MHASLTSDLLLAQSSNGQLSQSNESGATLEDIIAREMKKLEEISKLQKGKKRGIDSSNTSPANRVMKKLGLENQKSDDESEEDDTDDSARDVELVQLRQRIVELERREQKRREEMNILIKLVQELGKMVIGMKQDVKQDLEQLGKSVEKVTTDVQEVRCDAANSSKSWSSIASVGVKMTGAPTANKMPESQLFMINNINNEQKEIERRAQNVMIFGLPQASSTEADEEQIGKLFSKLKTKKTSIVFVRRFKSAGSGRIAPVLVRLTGKEERNTVLSEARKLRYEEEYRGVYLKPDMTEAERFGHNQLRTSMKKANEEEESKDSGVRYRVAGHRLVQFRVTTAERDPTKEGRPSNSTLENLMDL